nr:leucine-rich repeat and immunoglobulin-like domain-containing nogo receptor-interacting protein 2 [Penaeus vannamei]
MSDGPEEIVAAERVVVDEDKTTSILCHADGNPTPNVTWTRDNNNNKNNNIYINSSGAVLASGIGEAKLLVEHASKADTGLYLCHASNSVASAAPVYTALVVTPSTIIKLTKIYYRARAQERPHSTLRSKGKGEDHEQRGE